MTILELRVSVSDEVLAYLQREAGQRNISLDRVVSEVIEAYYDEPSDEQILAGLRRSMQQALAGNVRPVRELLDELDNEIDDNADNG